MALENNLGMNSDAELKAFLSSILSSEGILLPTTMARIATGCLPDARIVWHKRELTRSLWSLP